MNPLIINGDIVHSPHQTLDAVLHYWGATPPFVVAVNKTFVPKHLWPSTQVQANDHIDVLSAISGG